MASQHGPEHERELTFNAGTAYKYALKTRTRVANVT